MNDIPEVYYYIIIGILFIYGVYSNIKLKIGDIKKIALKLVVEAELQLQNGDEKYEYVSNIIYASIPSFLRLFLTEKMIQKLIKKAVEEGIEKIKDKINSSDNDETTIEDLIKTIKNSDTE